MFLNMDRREGCFLLFNNHYRFLSESGIGAAFISSVRKAVFYEYIEALSA